MNLDEVFKKTIFLLGAGASIDVGCKSSGEMLSSLRISLMQSRDETINKVYLEIYDFIIASLSFHYSIKNPLSFNKFIPNIEDFVQILNQLIDKEYTLPYPLVGNWNDKIVRWEMKEGQIFENYKAYITKFLIEEWLLFKNDELPNFFAPIHTLLANDQNFEINIFTLNYDLTFESSFNTEESFPLATGFEGGDWTGIFGKKLNYYKLHGSKDWFIEPESESVKRQESQDDRTDTKPFIIFGSDFKMLSFDPFLYLLSKFREKLEEAELYVVIGYSFHDRYLNNLIIQQLMKKKR